MAAAKPKAEFEHDAPAPPANDNLPTVAGRSLDDLFSKAQTTDELVAILREMAARTTSKTVRGGLKLGLTEIRRRTKRKPKKRGRPSIDDKATIRRVFKVRKRDNLKLPQAVDAVLKELGIQKWNYPAVCKRIMRKIGKIR